MKTTIKFIDVIFVLLVPFAAHPIHAATLPGIPEFIDEMVARHHFQRAELENAFTHAQHLPAIIELISRPATAKPWPEYRAAFVNPERIKFGLKFWDKYQQALQSAERQYGVPLEIILAVIGVETVYGRDTGTFRTLDALTTLAFDYPRRAEFFRSELENYLLLAREQQLDLLAIRGSYAGAMGIPQFMPSSYRNHAVDFNGNHKIDLLNEPTDAIGSVANYLRSYGWEATTTNTATAATAATDAPLARERSQLKQPVAVLASLGQTAVGQAAQNGSPGATSAPRTIAAWAEAGFVSSESITAHQSARLVDFTLAEGKEYWLVFKNFEVITRYNNSDFYAMSVFQLAQALKQARQNTRAK